MECSTLTSYTNHITPCMYIFEHRIFPHFYKEKYLVFFSRTCKKGNAGTMILFLKKGNFVQCESA